ncbi:MAG: substrate-binding domain-containing protein, partial [Verrucomicrobia subdivision 3 bacterium]|nr:substrate-binding domain-containing protein [Limisphaerales bacterium]
LKPIGKPTHEIPRKVAEKPSNYACCGMTVNFFNFFNHLTMPPFNWPPFNSSTRPWTLVLGLVVFALFLAVGCAPNSQREVVVYASQDQVYAEPILHEFTARTGIRVRPVYDSEAVKAVALAQRLFQEKSRPQCDVFWNNEALRTHQLAAGGVMEEFASFGSRSRRIVVNTNLVSFAEAPKSLLDLTNAAWRGKVALAYPLFGTTATHLMALRLHWGAERWEIWCRGLQQNKPLLLDGNSVVVRFVGRGEALIGWTDSDDIMAAQRQGLPVMALPLTDESLLIPNTVAIVKGAPHLPEARELFNFLNTPWVEEQLLAAGALETRVSTTTLAVNWDELLRDLDAATETLRQIFLR